MREDWKNHLIDAGAEFEEDDLVHYGNPERERQMAVNGEVICDLSHLGLLEVRGEDATDFLQGQFGNDIHAVDAGHSQLSSYSSPKGRAYAVFRVLRSPDGYLLEMPADRLEPVAKRLQMFVLRARVIIEHASDSRIRFGLSGPNAEEELRDVLGVCPAAPDEVAEKAGVTVVRTPGIHPRFELFGELDAMRRAWDALNVHAAPVGPREWALLDILAGLPTVVEETSEMFVPQMLNLHALGAISFEKGCYPGQEVVARMHYLGKLKRRMFRLAIHSQERPQPGSPVFRAGGKAEQPDGEIVAAELHPDGLYSARAVLQVAATEGTLHWDRPDGPQADIVDLPYDVPGEA